MNRENYLALRAELLRTTDFSFDSNVSLDDPRRSKLPTREGVGLPVIAGRLSPNLGESGKTKKGCGCIRKDHRYFTWEDLFSYLDLSSNGVTWRLFNVRTVKDAIAALDYVARQAGLSVPRKKRAKK